MNSNNKYPMRNREIFAISAMFVVQVFLWYVNSLKYYTDISSENVKQIFYRMNLETRVFFLKLELKRIQMMLTQVMI
jgi:hypothetical protein